MATASNFARLLELNLAGSGIKATGLAKFAESPYMLKLTTLDLSHNPLRQGLPALWESRLMGNLTTLNLRHCDLDTQSVRPLLTDAFTLQTLDLRDNPLINHHAQESLRDHFGPRILL
jgi:hypothetical protein